MPYRSGQGVGTLSLAMLRCARRASQVCGSRGVHPLAHGRFRRHSVAAVAGSTSSSACSEGKPTPVVRRRLRPSRNAAATLPSYRCPPSNPFAPSLLGNAPRLGGHDSSSGGARLQLLAREFSTRRGLPPGRSLPEKIFAGAVVAVLAAWGLVFGAITLLLLPFVGIALFLLRRNFQRGGVSRNVAARLARRMAERGGVFGGGGPAVGGVPRRHGGQTEGVFSSLLGTMLGGGLRGMELVGVLRSEIEKRALRHPGLSSALGGGVGAFSDVQVSSVGTFSGGGGGGDRLGTGPPSTVTKARLRFSGQSAGSGGWAEVEVSEWDAARGGGEEGEGLEFDRIFVILDNGRTFDLTSTSSSDVGASVKEGEGAQFRRRSQQQGSGTNKRAARKGAAGKRAAGAGRPMEAEFRDK